MLRKKYINKKSKNKLVVKKKKMGSINRRQKTTNRYLKDMIEARYMVLTVVIVCAFSLIGIKLFDLQVVKNDEYSEELAMATEKTIESTSAPRGRIYDRNHKLIVDNEAIKTIYYKKQSGITTEEEIELAKKVGSMISVDYSDLTTNMMKEFWYVSHEKEANEKITDEEWKQKSERKLDDDDIKDLIFERITDEEINFDDATKEASYIYYLMNKGYSYAEKIIKNEDVLEEEYALISENIDSLKGFNTKLDWERIYLYGDTFKSILGTVSSNSQLSRRPLYHRR